MRWLGLLLVLVAVRAAAAPCGHDIKPFPENDATDVVLNTHLWVPAGIAGPYVLTTGSNAIVVSAKPFRDSPMLEIDPGELLPDHFYTLTAGGTVLTSFATGRARLGTAAAGALIDHVRITDGVLDLKAHGLPTVGTQRLPMVMLHISIHRDQINGDQVGELWLPSEGIKDASLAECTSVNTRLGDTLCFWITAVNAVGFDGGGGARCAVDKQAEKAAPAPIPAASSPESSSTLMTIACAAFLALIYVGWRNGRERLYCQVCESQPIEGIAVGWIARRQMIRQLIALGVVAVAAYFVLPLVTLAVILAADLWRLFRARTASTAILDPRRKRAYVTRDGRFHGWVSVRPGDLARATAALIPTARLL